MKLVDEVERVSARAGILSSRRWGLARLIALGFLVWVPAVACSASSGSSDSTAFGGSGGNGSGGKGSGGFSAVGSGGSAGGGINVDGAAASGGAPLEDGQACVGDSYQAEQSPLDLYLMVDKSGSMLDNTPSKWTSVSSAITGFVNQSPATDGIGVGIAFFPIPTDRTRVDMCTTTCTSCTCVGTCGCGGSCSCITSNNVTKCTCPAGTIGNSCDVNDYAKATVEIGLLPQAAQGIVTAIAGQMPAGGTPTGPALEGAIKHARDWAIANSGHKVAVVLATDGLPTECNSTVPSVAQLAAAAYAGAPRIPTYVIGVGGSLTNLNQIAAAGGTNQAYIVDAGPNATQQFIDAMNRIRGLALACEFLIPKPTSGQLDYSKVNVQFTPPTGGPAQFLQQVPNAAACDPVAGGWYYDNPSAPTRIYACPASCDGFNVQVGGKVDILLGCKTITAPPK